MIILIEKHHIIFKSQGGLDFELNYKYLSSEDHRGNLGPHLNRKVDLHYKRELELKLRKLLRDEYYTIEELIDILGLKKKQAYKAFRIIKKTEYGMRTEDVIFRLLGGSFYL